MSAGSRASAERRWPRTGRLLVALGLILLLASLGWLGGRAYRTWEAAQAVRADLDRLEAMVEAGPQEADLGEAVALLHMMQSDLERLEEAGKPFLALAPYLGWVPGYGPDIRAAPILLEIAREMLAAGEAVTEPLAPVLGRVGAGEGSLLREAALTLAAARPQLETALERIERAWAARERLQEDGLSPRLQGWVGRLDQYLPLFERGVEGALLLPELLGVEGRRVYLILVQNEDELRPTGGFISGVARVEVEDGDLREVSFEDSYAIDDLTQPYPQPPEPLREIMLADLWLFRDSNWSPDFPTSAETAILLYAIGRGVEANGVVALDQQAVRLLVDALGPLRVEGCSEPIGGRNVLEMARRSWEPGEEVSGEWWRHRKDFMAALLQAALRRLHGEPRQVDPIRLGRAMLRALEQKDLLVYLRDERSARLLADLGWDGAVRDDPGDYLMVVDTNVGFNKVNALVEESLEYEVDLSDVGHPRAILTVRHRHPLEGWQGPCRHEPRYDPTYEQMTQRCYWDYLRVLVPQGSRLSSATGHPVPGEAMLSGQPTSGEVKAEEGPNGRRVFATLLLLQPGQHLETRFEYRLPSNVLLPGGSEAEVTYVLTVQKQPGTREVPLRVSILLPPGAEVVGSDPPPTSVEERGPVYTLVLRSDQTLRVMLRLGQPEGRR